MRASFEMMSGFPDGARSSWSSAQAPAASSRAPPIVAVRETRVLVAHVPLLCLRGWAKWATLCWLVLARGGRAKAGAERRGRRFYFISAGPTAARLRSKPRWGVGAVGRQRSSLYDWYSIPSQSVCTRTFPAWRESIAAARMPLVNRVPLHRVRRHPGEKHLLDVQAEVAEVGVGVLHRVDGLEVVETPWPSPLPRPRAPRTPSRKPSLSAGSAPPT